MNEDKKKRLKSFAIDAIKMLMILMFCAFLGIWYAVGSRAGSPERFAREYFKYYASSNYSGMYDMVECEEDEFINEDHFTYKYESERLYGGVKTYEFHKTGEKSGKITYNVEYMTGTGQEGELEIVVKRQKKHVYGVFSTWKVSLENEIAKNCSIGIVSGLNGYIDHIPLDSCENGLSEDGTMHYYFIDRMFKGDHVVTLNHENITGYTFSESVDKSGEQMIISSDMLELPEDDKDEMYNYSKFLLSSMYGYAMDGKTQFDDFAYMFYDDETTKETARNCFDNLRASTIQEDGALLEQITINNVSVALTEYKYPSDALINVAYTYSYVARTGRTSISGITKNYDGMGTAMATIRYKLVDGTWKVTDISMPCADYSMK